MGLKRKYLPSLFSENPEDELQAEKDRKASKSKKRKAVLEEEVEEEEEAPQPQSKKRKKKKKKKKPCAGETKVEQVPSSSQAQKASPTKRKNKGGGKDGSTQGKKEAANAEVRMSDARMEAFLQKPNQIKRKVKKQKFKQQ